MKRQAHKGIATWAAQNPDGTWTAWEETKRTMMVWGQEGETEEDVRQAVRDLVRERDGD